MKKAPKQDCTLDLLLCAPMLRSLYLPLLASALALGAVLLTGCDNTIEPFSEPGAYSVYGYLTAQKEPHFIRVRALKQPIGVSADSLNATVSITNQKTGTTRTLQDSVVVFDGETTHNYWAEFETQSSTTYKLAVDGSEGKTQVQVTTPTGTDPVVVPSRADACQTVVRVIFRDAKRPVRVNVGFEYEAEMHWVARADIQSPANREDQILQFIPERVLGEVIPTGFRSPPACTQIDDGTLQIAFLYADPTRSVDDDDLLQRFDPTESKRVSGGTGFFGAIRRDTISMEVDTTVSLE